MKFHIEKISHNYYICLPDDKAVACVREEWKEFFLEAVEEKAREEAEDEH